jgi:glutathione S-transferase
MLKLLQYALCPASRAIRLALNEMDIACETQSIKPWLFDRDFLNLQPAGALPVLMDGERAICGASPIAEYLQEKGPEKGARANGAAGRFQPFPGSLYERAEARRIAEWFTRKTDAEVTQYLLEEKVYKPMSGIRSAPDLAAIRAARANLRYHLSYLSYLADQRRWLAGDVMSFADFAAAGHVSTLDYLGEIAWEDAPEAKAWYARIKSRPAFRPLLAERLPGIAPPEVYADLDF